MTLQGQISPERQTLIDSPQIKASLPWDAQVFFLVGRTGGRCPSFFGWLVGRLVVSANRLYISALLSWGRGFGFSILITSDSEPFRKILIESVLQPNS